MTPDQLREWKKQQAEQGDGGAEAFIRERYSTNLDSMICPGNGLAPSREATRDAFFDGLRVGWKAALSPRPDVREQPAEQFEKGNCVPVQPHLFWWTCRMCGTATAGEGPPTSHVCSNPNGKPYQQAEQGDGGPREALCLCVEALDKHDEWCGHSKHAPGNSIWQRARYAALVALTQPPRQSEDGRMREAEPIDPHEQMVADGMAQDFADQQGKVNDGWKLRPTLPPTGADGEGEGR
jgi:hypothetical protein